MNDSSPALDERHQKRVALMQQLFAYDFHHTSYQDSPDATVTAIAATNEDTIVTAFGEQPTLDLLITQLAEIDELIQLHAPERPVAEINKIDLAILRLIVFESKEKKTPKKVLINEAVELAKEFGTASSPKFVNGVLAPILLPES